MLGQPDAAIDQFIDPGPEHGIASVQVAVGEGIMSRRMLQLMGIEKLQHRHTAARFAPTPGHAPATNSSAASDITNSDSQIAIWP